jgi:hypothetical protein
VQFRPAKKGETDTATVLLVHERPTDHHGKAHHRSNLACAIIPRVAEKKR